MNTPYRSPLAALFLYIVLHTHGFAQDDVSTGPSVLLPSAIPSVYMRGMSEGATVPVRVRLMGARMSAAGLTANVLLLDSLGNCLGPSVENGVWSARWGCRGEALTNTVVPIVEQTTWRTGTPNRRVEIVLDHSITSRNLAAEALLSLRDVLPGITSNDSIGVAVFDHTSLEISPLAPPTTAAERCGNAKLAAASGVPAVLTALLSGLRVFDGKPAEHNIIILVTASDDMASLAYSSADVVREAHKRGAEVYVVKVGSSLRGYVHRYLTAATGGRMYSLALDQMDHVGHIVREILYASKHHLEAFIPLRKDQLVCEDLLLHLGWAEEGGPLLADTLMFPLRDRAFRIHSAVVAAFEDTTERGLQDYYPILAVIAEDLMADSNKRLRLTGHVSPDVAGDALVRGFERAEHVAGYLKAYGVKEQQLDIQTAGNNKPLYYLQLDGTQRLLNNRVEASYLLPEDQPYTIMVERVASEELAIERVDAWTAKGFKAYFEPAVQDRKPVYDIILWGYRTKKDAEQAARSLSKHGVKSYEIH